MVIHITRYKKWKGHGEDVDNSLILLSYVSKHRNAPQSISSLANDCGIPKTSLYRILRDAYDCKCNSLLFGVAMNYGFEFFIYPEWNDMEFPSPKNCVKGRVIDVEKRSELNKYSYNNK